MRHISRSPVPEAECAAPWPDRAFLHDLAIRDPRSSDALLDLLRRLYRAGRKDLAAARLLEGHIDAVQLIRRYGRAPALCSLADDIQSQGWCGVWNADLPGAGLRLEKGRLTGGKSFASGAGLLTHALVTCHAGDRARVQLLLIDLRVMPPAINTQWWDVVGMQASRTHQVSWADVPADAAIRVGQPGDYEREPWFSGGALRYAAAQAGGAAALFDAVRDHLGGRRRDSDPHQKVRLARLLQCADLAAGACRQAAAVWFDLEEDAQISTAAHAALTVSDQAAAAIALAQESIGVESLFRAHPACRILTDLMVYIRQPAPDRRREQVGAAASHGLLRPDL